MTWIARSLPREPDDDPPAVPPPDAAAALIAERAVLLDRFRPRVRSSRQERIRRQIRDLTRAILALEAGNQP